MTTSFRFGVGEFNCLAVSDGTYACPAASVFTNLAAASYESTLVARGQSLTRLEIPLTSLVIETGTHRLLVDTGGGKLGPQFGGLVPALAAEGIAPGDIDIVVISHAHPDHIGGNLDATCAPVFSNARHIVLRAEWEYWMSEAAATELSTRDQAHKDFMRDLARRALSGVGAERLDPGESIVAGIKTVALPGHCPGQMGIEIVSSGKRLLFVADAIIDPIAVDFPEAIAVFDHVPEVTVATRVALLERAAAERITLATSHCPFPGLGRIERSGAGWRWEPLKSDGRTTP
jgi:glyoxylase-like metal-dependent hydrolase (beta-lactamase superfamily II)